jgi:DNA replication protein DnaC
MQLLAILRTCGSGKTHIYYSIFDNIIHNNNMFYYFHAAPSFA